MNIPAINLNTGSKIYKTKNIQPLKPLNFSSREHIFDNGNSYRAYLLGKDLFDNPKQPVEKVIAKYAPSIKVLPIDGTKYQDMDAIILHNRNDNFEAENIRICAPLKPKHNLKSFKLAYVLPLAHEFTHYMQLTSATDIEFMKKISDNNINYLRSFLLVADALFDDFDMAGLGFANKIYNFRDAINEKIYGFAIPRVKSFSKENLLISNGINTFGDFKEYMLKMLDESYDNLIDEILNGPEIDEGIKTFVDNQTSTPEGKNKLKEKIRIYSAYKAKKEKEAYQTESALSKTILKTNKQLNTDSSVLYYSMLEKALS